MVPPSPEQTAFKSVLTTLLHYNLWKFFSHYAIDRRRISVCISLSADSKTRKMEWMKTEEESVKVSANITSIAIITILSPVEFCSRVCTSVTYITLLNVTHIQSQRQPNVILYTGCPFASAMLFVTEFLRYVFPKQIKKNLTKKKKKWPFLLYFFKRLSNRKRRNHYYGHIMSDCLCVCVKCKYLG